MKKGGRYRRESRGGAGSKPTCDELGDGHPGEGGGIFFSGQKRPEREGKFKYFHSSQMPITHDLLQIGFGGILV